MEKIKMWFDDSDTETFSTLFADKGKNDNKIPRKHGKQKRRDYS